MNVIIEKFMCWGQEAGDSLDLALKKSPGRVVLLLGLAAFLYTRGYSLWTGVPLPGIHDEMSYWLAADTFAHGRLNNPVHPMWEHFETYHEMMQPSYMSKYPPANGLFLALGQIGGHPVFGVWLATALSVAALYLMLVRVLPGRMALGGTLLLGYTLINIPYFSNTYMGINVSFLGGCLFYLAVLDLLQNGFCKKAPWIPLALGLLIMANSRPFEGFIVALPVLTALAVWILYKHRSSIFGIFCSAWPGLGVLVAGLVLMGLYNYKATGHILKMPYSAYEEQYTSVPVFLFLPVRPEIHSSHPEMQKFEDAARSFFLQEKTRKWPQRFLDRVVGRPKMAAPAKTYFWIVPLLFVLGVWYCHSRWAWWSGGLIAWFFFCHSFTTWFNVQYLGVLFPLFFYLILRGTARFLDCEHAMPGWRKIACGLLVTAVVLMNFGFYFQMAKRLGNQSSFRKFREHRHQLELALGAQPGGSLVLVDYTPDHDVNQEWVYNQADIDQAPVVWARSMGQERDREIADYFKNRKLWKLHVGVDAETLVEAGKSN